MAVTLSLTATDQNQFTTGDTHTFSGVSLGAEAADRLIFVATTNVPASNDRVISVTVAGGATTRAGSLSTSNARMWWAAVPTGTTGDIVLTFTTSAEDEAFSIHVYRVIGANTTTPVSDTAEEIENTTDANISGVIDVPTDGALIAVCRGDIVFDGGGPLTMAWTNASEDSDFMVDGGVANGTDNVSSTASSTTSGAGQTITATVSGTPDVTNCYLTLVSIAAAAAAGQPTVKRWGGIQFNSITGNIQGHRRW